MALKTTALLLFILSSASVPSHAAILSTNTSNALDNFVQCFLALTHFSASHILITNATSPSLYNATLQSTAQNARFLASASTRKPAIIATPEEEWHVSVVVQCAHTYDLQLRVRSGGHDAEGTSYVVVNDDMASAYVPFVDVDLGRLRRVDVDAGNRTAWVQAGATLGELAYYVFTKSNNSLGFPVGSGRTVGVGGFISSGGLGPMSRKFGTAADNVVDAKIVTTCGTVLDRAAMGEELFWAIRGGGAVSFGIALAYKIKLVDVPAIVYTVTVAADISMRGTFVSQIALQAISKWQDVAPKLDDGLELALRLVGAVSSSGNVSIQLQAAVFSLTPARDVVNALNNAFPELGLEVLDFDGNDWLDSILIINGMSGMAKESLLNRSQDTPGTSFKNKTDFVTTPISSSQWDTILRFVDRTLSAAVLQDQRPVTVAMAMQPMGGKMGEISESAIAFPHRRGNLYMITYTTTWSGGGELATRKHVDLMANISTFMTPFVSSSPRAAYYGYKDLDLGRNKGVMPSYGEGKAWGERYFKGNYERLARVKRAVDAGNFFRSEQSIPPYNSWGSPQVTFVEQLADEEIAPGFVDHVPVLASEEGDFSGKMLTLGRPRGGQTVFGA